MNSESADGIAANSKRNRIRTCVVKWARAIGHWFSQLWTDIRPGPEARRGAIWGSLAAAFLWAIVVGRYMKTGFGLWFDLGFCLLAGALIILISTALVPLLLTILRKLPRLASGIIFGCVIVILLGLSPIGILAAPVSCLVAAFLGAAVSSLRPGYFK